MPMAKSTYYFEINKIDAVATRNAELLKEIQEIFENNKQRYGVYSLKKSDEKYRQIGANNIISTEEIELYEIKNQGLLCYYENDVKSYDEYGNINLKIIGVGENGIYESDMSYAGPEENIVELKLFELADYGKVLI